MRTPIPFLRGKQAHRERNVQLPGAFAHVARRNVHHQVIALLLHLEHLYRMVTFSPVE
jgi:hypothetical protein